MRIKSGLFFIALGISLTANSLTLTQAKKLYTEGRFEEALSTFQDLQKKNPQNANYNQWLGGCLYETGKKEEAIPYLETALSKKVADAARYLAQIALEKMDYEQMESLTRQFENMIDNDESVLSDNALAGYRKLKRTTEMLNNVEKIQIFDSLTVSKKDFFKHYKLSLEAGTLNTPDILPASVPDSAISMVYMPQSANRMIWAMPDSTGRKKLVEIYKLADGKWDKPTFLSDELTDNGDVDFPFIMADGTTIYYAGNGENSIGGYDIYMSRKDFASGEYLQPQNIGFPYNSPFDDYMLVIDEMTGIGWWATDRNQIPGKLTIYIFKRNDFRENYDSTNPNIFGLASVKSIKDTWTDNNDYKDLITEIKNIAIEESKPKADFSFYIKNGVEYTRFDDFVSPEAESLMHKRMKLSEQIEGYYSQLKTLRKQYARSQNKNSLISEILRLERAILKDANEVKRMDNEIRAIEIPMLKK